MKHLNTLAVLVFLGWNLLAPRADAQSSKGRAASPSVKLFEQEASGGLDAPESAYTTKCDDMESATPKPAGSCTAPQILFCEYRGVDCTISGTSFHAVIDQSAQGRQTNQTTGHLRSVTSIQCDVVNGVCPDVNACVKLGLSRVTQGALNLDTTKPTAPGRARSQRGERVQ